MKKKYNETTYGNQGALLNNQTAAKTSIDFLVKYTAQLKIQLIKSQIQVAAMGLNMLGKLVVLPPAVSELHVFILAFSLITEVKWDVRLHRCYTFSM